MTRLRVRAAWLDWSEELKPLRLSHGGRIAFTVVVLVVLPVAFCTGLVGVGFAFYNLFSGRDPDTLVSLQLVFVVVVVLLATAVVIGVSLGVIAAIDAAVRGVRWCVHRYFANPSS